MPPGRPLKELLAAAGIRPSRRRGQNFLVDANLRRFIVRQGGLEPGDGVLEVGAGTGLVTRELAAAAGVVWAIEVDAGLLAVCRRELAHLPNVRLFGGDFADPGDPGCAALRREVEEAARAGRPLKAVCSFPYVIASRAVVDLVSWPGVTFAAIAGLLQLEVARRLAAGPGEPAYGLLSVLVQGRASCRLVRQVPPEAFWPRPAVCSALVELRPRTGDEAGRRRAEDLARRLFAHPRQTIARGLRGLAGEERAQAALAAAGFDGRWRPADLSPAQYAALAGILEGK